LWIEAKVTGGFFQPLVGGLDGVLVRLGHSHLLIYVRAGLDSNDWAGLFGKPQVMA